MGEALVRAQAQKSGYTDWTVHSAGTWAELGQRAASYSIEAMKMRGYDISKHRSRQVTLELISQSDLVLTMTRGHMESLQAEFPNFHSRIRLFSMLRGVKYDIADPYGKPTSYYIACADELEDLVNLGWKRLCQWLEIA